VAAAYDAAPAVLCKIPIHFLCKDKERSAFFPCAIAIHMHGKDEKDRNLVVGHPFRGEMIEIDDRISGERKTLFRRTEIALAMLVAAEPLQNLKLNTTDR
jgi:hypothetical protein